MVSRPSMILLLASTVWMLGDGMLGPLFAVFADQVGGSILDITSAWATFLAVTGIGIVIVGKISDHFGKEVLMIVGYALSAIFTFGYLLVDSPGDLLVVQIGLGVALAFSQPTWLALYDKYSGSGKDDGFLWGLTDGLGYIASAIAILIGGFVITAYSFDVLFITMGLLLTLATVIQALIFIYKY